MLSTCIPVFPNEESVKEDTLFPALQNVKNYWTNVHFLLRPSICSFPGSVHFSKLLMSNQNVRHSTTPLSRKPTQSSETQASLFQAPERILDAPELVDDYYLNLLDWSSRNTLAIALSNTVYLWNAASGTIHELMEAGGEGSDDYVTSVSWAGDGKHLAVGLGSSEVQLWDCETNKQVTSLTFSPVYRIHFIGVELPVRSTQAS